MWQIAMLALVAAPPAANARVTVEGQAFGPAQAMICIWFSNFENSRFVTCRAAGHDLLPPGESASVQCRPGICDALDAWAARVAGWRKPEAVWGTFVVRLVGRLARAAHEPRYLNDGTRTVLVERLLSVAKPEASKGGR
jgi:hypothetical protein